MYNAPDDVRRCVRSVLAHTRDGFRARRSSTTPRPTLACAEYLAELAQRALPQVTVLRNERNLGFTATANRGIALSRADVVLLNSDTIVGAAAGSTRWCIAPRADPAIGTITPFSNNAEICSFPRFCENNPAARRQPRPPRSATRWR